RQRRVLASGQRVTGVRAARVVVVAVEGRAGHAHARLAGLHAVARVAVAARGSVRQRRVPAPGHRVAGVRGAGIVVVAVERRPGGTGARLARLAPVARVAVAARGAVRQRRAPAAGERVARVRGARVAVVAVEGGARGADPRQARLRAVAHVPVAARRAVRHRRVLTAGHRVARVGGARVGALAVERRPGGAGARLAGLSPVAHVPVAARRAVREREVATARDRVAAVRRARVAVVAVERGGRGAHAQLAGLGPVAHVPVAARGPVQPRYVQAAGGLIAAVRRARVPVVAVERVARDAGARPAGPGAVAGAAVAALGVREAGLADARDAALACRATPVRYPYALGQ